MHRHADNFVDFQARAREFSVGDSVFPFGMFESQAGRVTAVWPAIGMVDVEFPTGERRFPAEELLRANPGNTGNEPPHTDSGMGEMVSVSAGPIPTPKEGAGSADGKFLNALADVPFIRFVDFIRRGQINLEWNPGDAKYEDVVILVEDMALSFGFDVTWPKVIRPGRVVFSFFPKVLRSSSERVVAAFGKKALYWVTKDRQYRMNRQEQESGCPSCPRCEDHSPLKKAIYKRRGGASERLLGCPTCMFLIKEGDIINFNAPVSEVEFEVDAEAKKKASIREHIDYGTTDRERRKHKYVVYARGSLRDAVQAAQKQHPDLRIHDLLLVATDHLGVNEFVYNASAK